MNEYKTNKYRTDIHTVLVYYYAFRLRLSLAAAAVQLNEDNHIQCKTINYLFFAEEQIIGNLMHAQTTFAFFLTMNDYK